MSELNTPYEMVNPYTNEQNIKCVSIVDCNGFNVFDCYEVDAVELLSRINHYDMLTAIPVDTYDSMDRVITDNAQTIINAEQEIQQLKAEAKLKDARIARFEEGLKAVINIADRKTDVFDKAKTVLNETPQQSLDELQADYLQSILAKYDCGAMEYVLRQELEQLRASVKDSE